MWISSGKDIGAVMLCGDRHLHAHNFSSVFPSAFSLLVWLSSGPVVSQVASSHHQTLGLQLLRQ